MMTMCPGRLLRRRAGNDGGRGEVGWERPEEARGGPALLLLLLQAVLGSQPPGGAGARGRLLRPRVLLVVRGRVLPPPPPPHPHLRRHRGGLRGSRGEAAAAAADKARGARKPSAASARGGCRRPASPGARLASLINAIFSGKRHSARQHPAPADEEPACSTAPSTARPCLAKTPPSARARARPSRSRSRTVRFLDIDGEVAVAAAASGCRRIPVVEVEEDSDGGEQSSDASSDLFELENLAAIAPGSSATRCRRACGDELPVYGTTGAGLRHGIGRRRPFGYGTHGRSWSRVV